MTTDPIFSGCYKTDKEPKEPVVGLLLLFSFFITVYYSFCIVNVQTAIVAVFQNKRVLFCERNWEDNGSFVTLMFQNPVPKDPIKAIFRTRVLQG